MFFFDGVTEMEGFVVSRVKEQFCWILHMWCWANLHQNPIIYIYTYTILVFLVKKRMLIVKPPCPHAWMIIPGIAEVVE
jgi:hypothetical protein